MKVKRIPLTKKQILDIKEELSKSPTFHTELKDLYGEKIYNRIINYQTYSEVTKICFDKVLTNIRKYKNILIIVLISILLASIITVNLLPNEREQDIQERRLEIKDR